MTKLLILIAAYAIKRQRQARFYSLAFSFLMFGAVIGSLSRFGVLPNNYFTLCSFPFGAIICIVLFSFGFVGKVNALKDDLKKLHIDLEEIVQATIRELERANEKLEEKSTARPGTTTALAEQKVRWIMSFIRDNYTADISREGLAAAVEMSPDHLSRMFNRINGMRIGEYVNQLRLEDAARRLRDSDASVIFIAMEVGYESLRHFNRVFNKIYGMTPSQYRSKTNKYYRTISVRTADGWTNPPLSRYL